MVKVRELIDRLQKIVDEGKSDYEVTCEGFCVGLDGNFEFIDEEKLVCID